MNRAENKIQRIKLALSHQEGDQVPAGEFFLPGFVKRCVEKWGEGFDPYRYFDLDYVIVTPNMDPWIRAFEIVKEADGDVVVKTGFGAVIRKSAAAIMPQFESFSVKKPEDMKLFEFDDPADPRRFYNAGDDQINCIEDGFLDKLPSWDERVRAYAEDFAIFGSLCEPYEYLWRIIGSENALYWLVEEPELIKGFVDRIGGFLLDFCRDQIEAGGGRLSGMYIWGDVAYRNGMLFSPEIWRRMFRPHVEALIDLCHSHGLMVIYHGCGNAAAIFEDLAEIKLDAYNPLEVKADLDAVELKKRFAGRMAFVGNIDLRILEAGSEADIIREVLYKLQAARGGGWIFQSDSAVTEKVDPESYGLALETLRKYGRYPLDIGIK